MTAVFIDNPIQTVVLGLIVEVVATPDVLAKIQALVPEDKAQALAALVAEDMREKFQAKDLNTVLVAGLIDEANLTDKNSDVIIALEHTAEQHTIAHFNCTSVALTGYNNGFAAIEFPALEPLNPENVSILGFCMPFAMVGGAEDLTAFESLCFPEEKQSLPLASPAVLKALANAFDLDEGSIKGVGYEEVDFVGEALSAFSTHAKMVEIASAAKNDRQALYTIKSVPVFITKSKIRVCFFSFDSYARRMPLLTTDGPLQDAYMDYVRDFRFVVEQLEYEGLSPIKIAFPSEIGKVTWDQVLSAPKLDNLYIEQAHPGLKTDAQGEAVALDVICMRDPNDGALVAATLAVLNENGEVLAQTNVFPLTIDGMGLVVDYAKAIAQKNSLDLDVTEGDDLYLNTELRALSSPPMMVPDLETNVTSRTLH